MKTTPRLLFSLIALILLAPHPRLAGQTPASVTTVHSFNGSDGEFISNGGFPEPPLILGQDGNLYGVTQGGGSSGSGTAFRVTPGGVLTTLHDFIYATDGGEPNTALVQARDGNFYGTTSRGGSGDGGVVFRMTPAGDFTVLHSFVYGGGLGMPVGALVQDSDGNFYGTTYLGGNGGAGTVFKMTPAGVIETYYSVPGNFTSFASPEAGVILATDGNLYGTTFRGGAKDAGTIYRITPAGELTILHTFTRTDGDGGDVLAALIEGSDGNFYGTTGSTVFRMTPAGVLTTLKTFIGDADGGYLDAPLVQGSDGNFYGTTVAGGDSSAGQQGSGTIFRITPSGEFTSLYSFTGSGADGAGPQAGVVEGSDHNFYGTTSSGGVNDLGTIFRLNVRDTEFAASTYQSDEAAATVSLQILRSSNSTGAETVQYATADGTALAGRDYTPKNGTLSWADGDFSPRNIAVHLLNPGEEYPNARRRFTVNLSAPTGGATLGPFATATVVLLGTTELPVINGAATARGAYEVPFSYQIKATHHPRAYSVLGLPEGLSVDVNSGLISGTPEQSGTFTLTLRAVNQGGEAMKTLTLTITREVPLITSPKTAQGTLPGLFTYQITATSGPTRFTVDGLGAGMMVNVRTGLIVGTPEGLGTHTLTLHAFNPAGEATQTLALTVVKATPVITSPASATGRKGQLLTYQITTDGPATQFHVLGLPPGLSVNRHTGLIAGVPTKTGMRRMTLIAYNGTAKGTATLTLTVTN